MIALVFDTETTGLIDNRTIKLASQPHVIEFMSQLVDLDGGHVGSETELLIRPPEPLPEKIVKITGITDEMLVGAPSFSDVATVIRTAIESAPLVIAHNASFDAEMLDIEFDRLGQKIAWPRLICTVEQTVHLRGYRMTLTQLHSFLIGGGHAEAHRARSDVEALVRCIVEMRKRGWL